MSIFAKKSLGQNFLVNPHLPERIADLAEVGPADTVIEVGPGTGVLTRVLSSRAGKVIAIEKDHRLIEALRTEFSDTPAVTIVEKDILEFPASEYGLTDGQYKVVANIPYYLTSHLIRDVLSVWPQSKMAVLMVQEEVARRLTAQAPDMNLLALSVQLYAKPSLEIKVSRNSFRPVPTVDSAIIKLVPYNNVDRAFNVRVLDIAKKAFGQKRKQLKATIDEAALAAAGIDPTARPEELRKEQWIAVAHALH